MFSNIVPVEIQHTPNEGREIYNENFLRLAQHLLNTQTLAVNQQGHGFIVGDVLRRSGALYHLADSRNMVEAQMVGVVSTVSGDDDFELTFSGVVSDLDTLQPGAIYYLSTDGGVSTTPGTIVQPVFLALTETEAFVTASEAREAVDFAKPLLAASFNDSASSYFSIPEDMVLDLATEVGAGTISYYAGQSDAELETDFVPVTLPIALQAGQVLRIYCDEDIGEFKTVTLRRIA